MMREQANCHGAASTCLSMPQASSYTLPPLNASGCLGRTLYWLSHQVEQTHNEWYPSNRKTKYRHHLHIRATLTCLFWSWWQFSHSLRRGNFCFNIIAVHPSFITCFEIFQKVFIGIQTIKQLLTEWQGSLFVHLSADAAQILRQHVASSVCQSK